MEFLKILVLALGISMDAFSLSLVYGTLNMERKKQLILSLIVALFHFIMPLLGLILGSSICNFLPFKINWILVIILLFLGIEMIISSYGPRKQLFFTDYQGMFLLAIAVSVDSLLLGTGLKVITNNYWLVVFVFFTVSFGTTYLGLKVGQKVGQVMGEYAVRIGGLLLLIMAIILGYK